MLGRIGTLLTDLRSRCAGTGKVRHSHGAVGCWGFSLLEVLVALAILGIGLGVIFEGIGQGLRLRGAATENVRLALIAERILGELPEREAAPSSPEEGQEDGFRWRLEAVAGVPAARKLGAVANVVEERAELVKVRLVVTAPSGSSWEMTTLLPRSAEAAP